MPKPSLPSIRPIRRSWRVAVVAAAVLMAIGPASMSVGPASADGGRNQHRPASPVLEAVRSLDRTATWTAVKELSLNFPTFHPQGLARVGDRLYLSSVEVLEAPVRYPEPVDGYDRTPGKGRGHLFELDLSGRLLREIVLGEGTVYHPGGIDFDGRYLWVPVAEYRPDSRSIVYRVDPKSLDAEEVFRVSDHIGGVVRDPDTGRLHGVSWGSRRFYTWTGRGKTVDRVANESHYIDFQDCASTGAGQAVCTGLTEYPTGDGAKFNLGGIAVVDLKSGTVGHEVPVTQLSPNGHVVTRNPVHLEVEGDRLRMWAAPDDGEESGGTRLLVLETPIR